MSRFFTMKTVLRQTSNSRIREVLDRLGHGSLVIPWEDLGEKDVEAIHDALKTLPTARYDEIEGIFLSVFDLACGTGLPAIREAADCLDDQDLLTGLPVDDSLYDQVVWVWLRRPDAIEFAGLIHEVDNLSWWRRRDDLPKREPDSSPETLNRLAAELSSLLEAEQGRGRRCTVEFLARTRTRHYFAYPDDYVQNVNAHDEQGQLIPRTFRRTFSVVFAFDPKDGALELYAGRLSTRIKQRIEVLFARVVFGHELGPWAKPTYDLDKLKYRGSALPTDPADRIQVSIRHVRMAINGTKRQVTLRADPDGGVNDIYDTIEGVLNLEQVPLSRTEVNLVTFCFEFLDASRGPGRTMTFDVAAPNTCSLRNQRPDRIDLVMKYLEQWGIYARRTHVVLGTVG